MDTYGNTSPPFDSSSMGCALHGVEQEKTAEISVSR